MVVHLVAPQGRREPTMVGFVVSKAIGNAVVRNTVKRRLRGAMSSRIGELPAGSRAVVRALAPAAHASYATLTTDLDSCLMRATHRRAGQR